MIQPNVPSNEPMFQRLLAAAKAGPAPSAEAAADFDWKTPCRFTAAQLAKLGELAAAAGRDLAKAAGDALRLDLALTPGTLLQQYAATLAAGDPAAGKYSLALVRDDGRKSGWITVAPATATAWVARLLGGAASGEVAARTLSSLELSLLLNVLTSAVKALSASLVKAGSRAMRSGDALADAASMAGPDGQAEFGRIEYHAGDPAKPLLAITLASDLLELLADAPAKEPRKTPDIRKDLLAHVGQVAVAAVTQLGESRVPMKDVLALEAGDVLVLDVQVGEPIPLLIQGQLVLAGVPVVCEGHYGLQVTHTAGMLTQK